MDDCQIEAHASSSFRGQHDVRLRFGSCSDLGLRATMSGESRSRTLAVPHHHRHLPAKNSRECFHNHANHFYSYAFVICDTPSCRRGKVAMDSWQLFWIGISLDGCAATPRISSFFSAELHQRRNSTCFTAIGVCRRPVRGGRGEAPTTWKYCKR
ncbi:hypothetical protein CCMA1212_001915 [Trichoderma ghanense]|uniref:Uncharacterized protein n=1 Tax=Trichoderma ghanense TaxID=65468 RepID=A0ABY2HCY1_9HYPO